MIVDVHTHCHESADHVDPCFTEEAERVARPGVKVPMFVTFEAFRDAMAPCDKVITFGIRARLTGLKMPNDDVARFVARLPEKLIGFMSIDPCEQGYVEEFERSARDLKLRGVKLGPLYAGFAPNDSRMNHIYERCAKYNLPIVTHVGTSFVRNGVLEHSRPILWDEIARRHPGLRIVLAHMGHPWEGETISVIRKHPHVYADISALHYRPWQFYNSMVLAQEYGVQHKILFGTDYPFTTPASTLEALRGINAVCEGTRLPRISLEAVEGIIHRDTLSVLWE